MPRPVLIGIVVVFALAVAGGSFFYMQKLSKDKQAAIATMKNVEVYVAAQAIPPRTIVEPQMIATKQIPQAVVTPETVTVQKDVLGKVTITTILPGETLVKPKLAEKGAGMGLAFIVPPGKRAFTITVDNITGVVGLIKPGDFVDVIARFQVKLVPVDPKEKEFTVTYAMTVLQAVQVLALDQATEVAPPTPSAAPPAGAPPAEGQPAAPAGAKPATAPSYTFVTLAINPEDAERAHLLSMDSTMRLTLRPINDISKTASIGIVIDDITWQKDKKILEQRYALQRKAKAEEKKALEDVVSIFKTTTPTTPIVPFPTGLTPTPTEGPKPGEKKIEVIRGTSKEDVWVPQ